MHVPKGKTIEFNGPALDGLRYRSFVDDSDFRMMSEISQLSWAADGVVWVDSEEDLKARFSAVKDRDPRDDVIFVDVDGETVGCAELSWDNENVPVKSYSHSVHLLPEWRDKGIREALFRHNEERLVRISTRHGSAKERWLQVWTYDEPNDWKRIVDGMGYTPVWHLLEMAHTNLPSVEETGLPDGLEMRPPREGEYSILWDLFRECFLGEPWFTPYTWSDAAYENWICGSTFDPCLIQVAWHGEKPVGIVEMLINREEIDRTGEKTAHAERVCVAEGWRRKGVASALLTSGLTQVRELGIEKVMLDTEAENKHRAMKAYMSVGFDVRRTFTFHRKSTTSAK